MKEEIAAGGSPSGDPSRERDFAIEVRNSGGVLVARYSLYGVPGLKLAYDLPVTILTTEDVTLTITGIKSVSPYDEVDSATIFPSDQDDSPTPEVFIVDDPDAHGPVDIIPDAVRQANEVNKQRMDDDILNGESIRRVENHDDSLGRMIDKAVEDKYAGEEWQ